MGLQFEPTAQKAMLSSSPYGNLSTLLAKSPKHQVPGGVGMFTKNIGDLMRHRSSTANSITTFLEEDIDVAMVETPRAGAPSFDGIPDFGFSFEK